MFRVPEQFRVIQGLLASTEIDGNNGAFMIHSMAVIASDQMGWEHVSVSLPHRCPTWDEMCLIKDIFWNAEDFVIQIHPAKSDYVNNHPYCLHLWRKAGTNDFCDKPPSYMVGIPDRLLEERKKLRESGK